MKDARGVVRVLGLGNVLLGDDALGPYVVRLLDSKFDFPEAVEVLDVGTPGLDLLPYLAGARHVIIVDTVRAAGSPGEIRLYRREEILATRPQPRLSPHDPGLRDALLTAEMADAAPQEVLLVGVIPEATETGVGLSHSAQRGLAGACAAVLDELERLGLPPTPRVAPPAPDIWWETPPSTPA